MTTYETKLRGARNHITDALSLASDNATKAKLSAIVTTLDDLIQMLKLVEQNL